MSEQTKVRRIILIILCLATCVLIGFIGAALGVNDFTRGAMTGGVTIATVYEWKNA